MKLKTKYLIYFFIIHVIFLAVTIVVYKYNRLLFVICEAAIVLSIILFVTFYKAIFRPFKLLHAGVESISDRDFSMKILPVGQPELDKLIEVFNKMIEQLRTERAIANEKNFFLEKLIEASPAAIIILDKSQNIRAMNPATYHLLKLDDKKPVPKIVSDFPSPWNRELLQLNDTGSVVVQLNGINQYKCYKSHFIDKGVKLSFFIIEELTKELLNAERQSYEKVIRMMSHEVNNSVGAVNSIIESSVNYMDSENKNSHNDFIRALNVASERIINLNLFTKRFADIVHIPPPEPVECDLVKIITHMLVYFHTELEQKNVKVTTKYESPTGLISFDRQQLELVLVNIMKNAIQAIPSDGMIHVIFQHSPPVLIIENTGEPIPDHIQKKLFEPFFTTKKTGQGIGLTLIRDILSNHGCDFSLKTRMDGITEFKIIFNPMA